MMVLAQAQSRQKMNERPKPHQYISEYLLGWMGKCFSKNEATVSPDGIDIHLVHHPMESEPSTPPYVSSRLLDVMTERSIIEYRISMSPTYVSSHDSSYQGRSSVHRNSSRIMTTPMGHSPRLPHIRVYSRHIPENKSVA